MNDKPKIDEPVCEKAGRRAYLPPRIVSREPLEVVAAVCSGMNAKTVPGFCDPNLLQS
jgi:hypothetical protein